MGNKEKPAVRFSHHARNRMRQNRTLPVTEDQVRAALATPIRETDAGGGKTHRWATHRGGWLRVTFRAEKSWLVVVTVTVRKQGPKG